MVEVFEFLEINLVDNLVVGGKINPSGIPRSIFLNRMMRSTGGIKKMLKKTTPTTWLRMATYALNRHNLKPHKAVDPTIKKRLLDYYIQDMELVASLTSVDCSCWVNVNG